MEIVIVIFLGVWVTACSLLAYLGLRRDLRDDAENEGRRK